MIHQGGNVSLTRLEFFEIFRTPEPFKSTSLSMRPGIEVAPSFQPKAAQSFPAPVTPVTCEFPPTRNC